MNEIKLSKGRIIFRLMGQENRKDWLTHVVHRPFLDMAITYDFLLDQEEDCERRVVITNELAEAQGLLEEDLWWMASINTPKIKEKVVTPIGAIISRATGIDLRDTDCPLVVMTNSSQIYGAATILYSGALEDYEGWYVLPSSVHEVIMLPEHVTDDLDFIKNMVMEVNRDVVQPTDVLTDSVYYIRDGLLLKV